jgi:hypothetical protein
MTSRNPMTLKLFRLLVGNLLYATLHPWEKAVPSRMEMLYSLVVIHIGLFVIRAK